MSNISSEERHCHKKLKSSERDKMQWNYHTGLSLVWKLLFFGRTWFIFIDHAENISFISLQFDLLSKNIYSVISCNVYHPPLYYAYGNIIDIGPWNWGAFPGALPHHFLSLNILDHSLILFGHLTFWYFLSLNILQSSSPHLNINNKNQQKCS